jgi:hypothetical protein
VVHIRVDRLTWDHRLSLNLHALVIYYKKKFIHGTMLERFEECQCEDGDVRLHCRTWVLGDGHYRWLRGLINPFPWSIKSNIQFTPFVICCIFRSYSLSFLRLLNFNLLKAIPVEILRSKFDFDSI